MPFNARLMIGIATAVLCVLCSTAGSRAGVTFRFLSAPADHAELGDISADGRIIVGGRTYGGGDSDQATLWKGSDPPLPLGVLPGYVGSFANAISADGSTVVGRCYRYTEPYNIGFRWTAATGMQALPSVPGYPTQPTAVNADGTVVVGNAQVTPWHAEAFRWTAATGLQLLPGLNGSDPDGGIGAISADGSTIVGGTRTGGTTFGPIYTAARWVNGADPELLAGAPEGSGALDMTSDGSTILVETGDGYTWTQAGGMQLLAALAPPGDRPHPYAISANASIILGQGTYVDDFNDPGHFIIWDSTGSSHDLNQIVSDAGFDLQGFTLESEGAVSAEGSVIVGRAFRGPSDGAIFMVTIPEPGSFAFFAASFAPVLILRRRRRWD